MFELFSKKTTIARLPYWLFNAGFTSAAIALQESFLRFDDRKEWRRSLSFFQSGAILRRKKWDGERDFKVFVINRAKDFNRLRRFSKSCRKWGIEARRVQAIDCSEALLDIDTFNSQVAENFYGKTNFVRGAVGCFLSHARTWKNFLKSDATHALICEDDVRFLGGIPARVQDFNFPKDAEIIFVNQRISEFLSSKSASQDNGFFQFYPVIDAAEQVIIHRKTMSAPGGEGYILSRLGAQKALSFFNKNGVFMEVDWFLFFLSLTDDEKRKFKHLDKKDRFNALPCFTEMLKSAVMTPSLLEQTDTGSTINVEIQKNHVTREALFLEKPKRADPSSIKNSESSFKLGRIPIQLSRFGYSCIAIFIQKIAFKFDPKPARFLCLQYLIAIKNVKTKNTNGIREFPVYVINRSCDHDRLNSFSARSKKWGVYYELVEGVDLRETINPLRRYQNRIANTCYASQNFIKGIYGCFLGHRRAWQKIVNSGVEWALVCEDDARFLGPLPLKIRDFGIPSDAEIVFCNLRMAEGFLGDVLLMGSNNGKIFSPIKVEEALDALLDFRQAFNAPGGDGYLLSNIGARKLLSNFEESQMAFDVDWFMLFNSIGDKSMEDFLYRDRTGRFDGFQLPSTRLNGYVLFPSLVEQAEGESKVMRREFCTREELFS